MDQNYIDTPLEGKDKLDNTYDYKDNEYSIMVELKENDSEYLVEIKINKKNSLLTYKETILFQNKITENKNDKDNNIMAKKQSIKGKYYFYKDSKDFLKTLKDHISFKDLQLTEDNKKGVIVLSFADIIKSEMMTTSIEVKQVNNYEIDHNSIIGHINHLYEDLKDLKHLYGAVRCLEKRNENLELNYIVLSEENNSLKDKLSLYENKTNGLYEKFNNKIIESDYKLINEWINDDLKNFKYKLLYKATIHGFSAKQFHFNVDGSTNILVIAITEKNDKIGGFTPVSFSCRSGAYTPDNSKQSFLFSLSKILKFKIIDPSKAVFGYSEYGPTFGGGHDLIIPDNSDINRCSSNLGFSYDNPQKHKLFEGDQIMKEIEVYTLRKQL